MPEIATHFPMCLTFIIWVLCFICGVIFTIEAVVYSLLGLMNLEHVQPKEWMFVLIRGTFGCGLLYLAYLLTDQAFIGG